MAGVERACELALSEMRQTRTSADVCTPSASMHGMGHGAGEFDNLHNLAIDSKGNIYAAEVQGKRVQKFRNLGGL